jgi:hypothetical protein
MAENSEDIAEILYSFVSATPSGTAGEKTLFNQNGDRRLVKLGTDIKYDNGTNVDKAVLTLLNKESKLYSLSIKVDKSKVVNLNSLKFKERRLYSSKTETYININLNQNINLSHVLFIGEVKQLGGNFKINKTILITKDVGKGQEQKYDDITDEEEYLNLHHIDYFSFMYDDFKKMYDEYKVKNERQQNPDSRKKINNAVNAVRASNRLKPLPKVQPAPEGAGAGAAAAAAGKKPVVEEEGGDKEEGGAGEEAARARAEEEAGAGAAAAAAGKKPVVEEEGGDKEEGGAGEEAARARAEEEAAVAAEQEAPRQEDEEEEDEDEAIAAARAGEAAVDNADGIDTDKTVPQLLATRAAAGDQAAVDNADGIVTDKQVPPLPATAATRAPTQQPREGINEGFIGGGKKKVKKTKTKTKKAKKV